MRFQLELSTMKYNLLWLMADVHEINFFRVETRFLLTSLPSEHATDITVINRWATERDLLGKPD